MKIDASSTRNAASNGFRAKMLGRERSAPSEYHLLKLATDWLAGYDMTTNEIIYFLGGPSGMSEEATCRFLGLPIKAAA